MSLRDALTRLDHAEISAYHRRLGMLLGKFDRPYPCPRGNVQHILWTPNGSPVEFAVQIYCERLVLEIQPILLSLFARSTSQ